MERDKLKKSFILKIIALITLPILLMIIGTSIFVIAYGANYPDIKTNTPYDQTDAFREEYRSELNFCTNTVKSMKTTNVSNYTEYAIVEAENKIAADDGIVYYKTHYSNHSDFYFACLVINTDTKEAYTNLPLNGKTNSIQKIREMLVSSNYYWNYIDGNILTNVNGMTEDEMQYTPLLSTLTNNGNQIYTAFVGDKANSANSFNGQVYSFVQKWYPSSYQILGFAFLLALIESIYLCFAIGHTKNKEEIHLNWIDKIPLEIFSILAFTVVCAFIGMTVELVNNYIIDEMLYLLPTLVCIYLAGISGIYTLGSYIKRGKAKIFWKNSLTYKVCHYTKGKMKKLYEDIAYNANHAFSLALLFGGFVVISILLYFSMNAFGFLSFLALVVFWFASYWFVLKRVKEFNQIKEAAKSIYEGNTEVRLNEKELKGVMQEIALYLNDIAGGFSNAVEESLKSERLKTELITNVSHDIKTPLTSIINYVDLLKREEIQDEKIKEYIGVLDSKSQRLKKLIEDLVEASKASSGNLKLNKEKLDIKELIKQVTGEFEDKLQEKKLNVILNLPKENTTVIADNRYLYRIIENLYSNVTKYALEGSRVYVDVVKNQDKTVIAIKNMSKDELNISVDELMQRFVRGDKARNTEGSGLGLSIAQSLTELQGGKFSIYLDGDLFKVVIEF